MASLARDLRRRFLTVQDADPGLIGTLLDSAAALKNGRSPATGSAPLAGRSVALIFEKPSLRTRVSFEVGVARLGGTPIALRGDEVGLGSRESPRDVARTLERYVDLIVARVTRHHTLLELAAAVRIPVINALSDLEHPCQALADLLALRSRWGSLSYRQLVYIGDGNNVARSLLYAAASVGLNIRLIGPDGYQLEHAAVERARAIASKTGSLIELGTDPVEGTRDADAVYTDVWASMGQEDQADVRMGRFRPYAVTPELMAGVPDALVMHCGPAHRGEEIADEVLDGPTSIVSDQAECRLWVQMALMSHLMESDRPSASQSPGPQAPD